MEICILVGKKERREGMKKIEVDRAIDNVVISEANQLSKVRK